MLVQTLDALEGILLPLFAGLITSGIAYRLGFFKRPTFSRPPIFLPQLLSVFGIYLGYSFVLAPFLQILLFRITTKPHLMGLQFSIFFALFLTLLLYLRTDGKLAFTAALKNPEGSSSRCYDFGFGMMIWLVAFPWTSLVNRFCDFVLYFFFHFENYEQDAILYLKKSLDSPFQLTFALIAVILLAPMVEEILFRGTLQQYLKKFFSPQISVFITAIIFASFHFSFSQQLGNLAIIPSLFVFACFLGYVYERQGSIYASIGLHSAFNLASSLQILFLDRL